MAWSGRASGAQHLRTSQIWNTNPVPSLVNVDGGQGFALQDSHAQRREPHDVDGAARTNVGDRLPILPWGYGVQHSLNPWLLL